ncbi:MAG: RtcB family protein, partial [Candidatus Hydrogenedentes bacterium]|nr:RtcB family protein [Candidatus Hydrogenedentota bacterium]
MKNSELQQLGIPRGRALEAARAAVRNAVHLGKSKTQIRKALKAVAAHPRAHLEDALYADLANAMLHADKAEMPFVPRDADAPFRKWGDDLDPLSIDQMKHACQLPVSVRGALMPDCHVGYGLPIGGVLATRNAVIPYAVGVDIACRMKIIVLDLPLATLDDDVHRLKKDIEAETRFGIGAEFKKQRRQHPVFDADWTVSPVTMRMKDRAWNQLGTSGSGNHFVEFGELEVKDEAAGLPPGRYLALLSHSGSRGTGAEVCSYYSKVAQQLHKDLPRELSKLAWLSLDSHEGKEYWAAMNLMGEYAAANHACIHRHMARHLGVPVLLDIENHHNFAWKEMHDGEELIVHRKGATPAHEGVLGIIPGSMATPGYVVRGKGDEASLSSAAHGAGRVMSRKQAVKTFSWREAKEVLSRAKVELMSAGLDEVPMVYKDIHEVMAAQSDLVEILAEFHPRLV